MSKFMFRFAMCVSFVALLAICTEQAYAAEKGNITGTVLSVDGSKPMVGFQVKLVRDIPMQMGRPGRGKTGGINSGATGLQGQQGGTKTFATATTDAQGRFNINNVEVGTYRLEGGNNNIGWLYIDVNVEANKTSDVGQQKLVKV